MQGIFQKENTDKARKYGIYRHLPTYEKIIRNLVSFYTKQREKIISNAKVMYNQKVSNDTTAGYVKSALDFQALEVLCDKYETIDSSLYPVV